MHRLRVGPDAVTDDDRTGPAQALARRWTELRERVAWTPPPRAEVYSVGKAALAASVAYLAASAATDIDTPVLAPLAAIITVRVSVHASVRGAIQRSIAVVIGVLAAVAVGSHLSLSALSVGLLTGVSLGVSQLLLRLERQAANQVPVSILVVMAATAAGLDESPWHRAWGTVIGAAVGVVVSLALPASRVKDGRETLGRLSDSSADLLDEIGDALRRPWTLDQTAEWRHTARVTRQRLVAEAADAVGNSREAAHWNVRDRTHTDELARYEEALPRLERTAIGVWTLARGLDDHAELTGGTHREMPDMAALLAAVATLVRGFTADALDGSTERTGPAVAAARTARDTCASRAGRQSLAALDHRDPAHHERPEREWMSYTALLVQLDRIIDDLGGPVGP